jgi:hypothetical protein
MLKYRKTDRQKRNSKTYGKREKWGKEDTERESDEQMQRDK